ncbi:MAG TPA: CehA/McbA family metallohydrolase [Vicinamibacterales bacterium]|nr:CehA/McbA family metallohydrolase [Vicinamibacterales bacterium]
MRTSGRVRALAIVVLAAGIAIGTAAGGATYRPPVHSGDDFILAADFHVHAAPGDGSLTPSALRDEAARAGLDVIAITNHNHLAEAPLVAALAAANDDRPIVLLGQEVTHPTYHLIAVGIDRVVRSDLSVADAVAAIHAQNGVAIAAHPTRSFSGYDDVALGVVDGTEVAHPERLEKYRRQYIETFGRARQLNPHVAPIGSSDIHNSLSIGQCRTFVFTRERSARGVIEAIREGHTVASDERGRLYGDASLVARVHAAMPKVRTDPHRTWRRAALILTWVGVAGVLLF